MHQTSQSLFYEDLEPGMNFLSGERTIVESDLLTFAEVSGDRHPIHTDAEYAARTEFGQRIAHGPFGIAMAIGLFAGMPEFGDSAVAMLDVSQWTFRTPIVIGDRIHMKLTITDKRLTRNGRAIVGRHFSLIRHDGVVTQEGDSAMLIRRRADV